MIKMAYNTNIIVDKSITLLDAIKLMDSIERKLLIITEDNKFLGLISIGDIQRALINKVDLSECALKFIRPDILIAHPQDNPEEIRKLMIRERIESMPVVDNERFLIDIIEWKDILSEEKIHNVLPFQIPVVIMAGGVGSRLKPLTNIIPKALIPVSDRTIIEEIMDRFADAGCGQFFLSLNYKSELISEYISKLNKYKVNYVEEKKPLGTAGSLYLLREKINSSFFVSNCDILVELDFYELYKYHQSHNNTVTVVSVLKSYNIPYGTLDTCEGGKLVGLQEKPDFVYQINSGVYLVEPEIFHYITENEYLDITTLLIRLIENGRNVGVFPLSSKSWIDMGNWDDYLSLIGKE